MATVTNIRIAVGRTVSLGEKSVRIDAELSVDLAEGETLADVTGTMQVQLRDLWETTYRAQKKDELPT